MEKKIVILVIALLSFYKVTIAQEIKNHDFNIISKSINEFVQYVDKRNIEGFKNKITNHFRAVINDPKKETIKIVDKNTYTNLLQDGKIGGVKRFIQIESIQHNNNMAIAKVSLKKGNNIIFNTFYSLYKQNNNWHIVEELVWIDL